MSQGTGDWRAAVDDVDAALVDGWQSGFPVRERPFEAVGRSLGVSGAEALERVTRLREAGIFRRFGPVLNPPVIGSSTLAALRVPADRFEETAEVVNGYRQVNHNYARDHEWNMWFVVTAASKARRDEILADVEDRTGLSVLVLPMLTDFYIDLEFPVVNADRFVREGADAQPGEREGEGDGEGEGDAEPAPRSSRTTGSGSVDDATVEATAISERATVDLSDLERRLLLAVQAGFPLSATPYRDVAADLDAPVGDVLAAVERLLDVGCIKRIGCVVNHLETGFDANCMVVWDVPDAELDRRGVAAGALPFVTLCYHRPRRPDQGWNYNLFTMVHGREQDAVDAKIDELAADHLPYPHERLYSTATLKQTGARYEALVGDAADADADDAPDDTPDDGADRG